MNDAIIPVFELRHTIQAKGLQGCRAQDVAAGLEPSVQCRHTHKRVRKANGIVITRWAITSPTNLGEADSLEISQQRQHENNLRDHARPSDQRLEEGRHAELAALDCEGARQGDDDGEVRPRSTQARSCAGSRL